VHEASGRVGLREMEVGVVIDDAHARRCRPMRWTGSAPGRNRTHWRGWLCFNPQLELPGSKDCESLMRFIHARHMAPLLYIVEHGCKLIGGSRFSIPLGYFTHRSIS
jgi:hypothetical protein